MHKTKFIEFEVDVSIVGKEQYGKTNNNVEIIRKEKRWQQTNKVRDDKSCN